MRVNRCLLHAAEQIHQVLERRDGRKSPVDIPESSWQHCSKLALRSHRADRHGFHLAAARLGNDCRAALERLASETRSALRQYDELSQAPPVATTADLYRDLLALHEEFENVSVDQQNNILSATTESIELEGIHLGPFDIRLDWSELAGGYPNPYRVIALEPHPAATNESVTHPHIQDELICEGEGSLPIRQALAQGRLLDFFLVVKSLLSTYNVESPYVALADWYGTECSDCGSSICEDEQFGCEHCSCVICSECHVSCPSCDGIFCTACVSPCSGCEEDYCRDCLKRCTGCSQRSCSACLDDQERCDNCHEAECEEESENETVPITQEASTDNACTPLHPHGVGEAAVSA